jgi:hypothetical protein
VRINRTLDETKRPWARGALAYVASSSAVELSSVPHLLTEPDPLVRVGLPEALGISRGNKLVRESASEHKFLDGWTNLAKRCSAMGASFEEPRPSAPALDGAFSFFGAREDAHPSLSCHCIRLRRHGRLGQKPCGRERDDLQLGRRRLQRVDTRTVVQQCFLTLGRELVEVTVLFDVAFNYQLVDFIARVTIERSCRPLRPNGSLPRSHATDRSPRKDDRQIFEL